MLDSEWDSVLERHAIASQHEPTETGPPPGMRWGIKRSSGWGTQLFGDLVLVSDDVFESDGDGR